MSPKLPPEDRRPSNAEVEREMIGLRVAAIPNVPLPIEPKTYWERLMEDEDD